MPDRTHQCEACARQEEEFDVRAAFARLSRKYEQLASVMTRYMSEAGLERTTRAANAHSFAAEAERIVGGSPTLDFPECCLVGRRSSNGTMGWFCTGVLVHPRIVLTAGHCFIPSQRANIVALRANDENQLQQAELVSVRRMVQHPRYRETHEVSDMSVIILRASSTTAPVPIGSPAEMAAAQQTTLVGFGNTDVNSTRGFGVKRAVTVDITDIRRSPADNLDAAEQRLGFESDLEFVAGGNGFDTCNGDSGGPAYITVGGARRLAGLTSRATATATHNCGDGGIYTRVDVHVDFIRQVARDAGITTF
ncbi:MAG: trypsin-like serine protease [Acidobacteria bacterium]|nr:trypsin-like serine protease [Acidobacteriota bacterium]